MLAAVTTSGGFAELGIDISLRKVADSRCSQPALANNSINDPKKVRIGNSAFKNGR